MKLPLLNIQDVAERHLCCGCGVCAYVDPDHVRMVDVLDAGRRPIVSGTSSPDALRACPGATLKHTFDEAMPGLRPELAAAWGPVLEVWEGYAADPGLRFAGSSGGAASAISQYCLERGGMHGVLHTAAREDVPYLNQTVMSRTREELLARTGSRYAPASPCDGLKRIEDAPAPCVFVGKPCDVAATAKARALRPALDAKLGVTIAIFCAGTPSTKGTLEMVRTMGIENPADVESVRYRGQGWPGKAVGTGRSIDGRPVRGEMTYAESWGKILQKHRQWRCYVCLDHTGEFADISVGDPWYRPIPPGEPGRSLVIARTERGRAIIAAAVAAGYLHLEPAKPEMIEASQPGFPNVRGSVWGRIWTCRLLGVATPVYRRMPMFRFWWSRLSMKEKLQSVYGTWKRVSRKKLNDRAALEPYEPSHSRPRPEPSARAADRTSVTSQAGS